MLESGPAGGGLATAFFGAAVGKVDVISFDMGGTTAKACLIENGRAEIAPMMEAARVHRFKKGSGLPIKAPVIDMIEIGAGGGSIAAIDEVGLLRVGPRSAGAVPAATCVTATSSTRDPAPCIDPGPELPYSPRSASACREDRRRVRSSAGARAGSNACQPR